jgi:hypothetical protein
MNASSVSPERCEMTERSRRLRQRMASSVSVRVPIWFSLMRIELAMPLSMPARGARVGDEEVVADELHLAPSLSVSSFQPSQSSSARPSSIETIGYFVAELS